MELVKVLTPMVDNNLKECICCWDRELLTKILDKEVEKEGKHENVDIFCLLGDNKSSNQPNGDKEDKFDQSSEIIEPA